MVGGGELASLRQQTGGDLLDVEVVDELLGALLRLDNVALVWRAARRLRDHDEPVFGGAAVDGGLRGARLLPDFGHIGVERVGDCILGAEKA